MKILIKEKLSEHKSKTPEGYLICQDAILARTGPQDYLKSEIYEDFEGDDTVVSVQRKPEQVFSAETLSSFEDKPITVEHPDENVNPDNYSELAVGHTRNIRKGKFNGQDVMIGDLVITDAQTIEDIEKGIRTELSCGYDCDITEGDHPEQINIRGNHVALCEQGRAGIAKIIDSKTVDNQTKEVSNERIEAIPMEARAEISNNLDQKGAKLLAIISNLEDIINAADPAIKEDLTRRANKIVKDLKRQFKIKGSQYKIIVDSKSIKDLDSDLRIDLNNAKIIKNHPIRKKYLQIPNFDVRFAVA